MLEFAAFGIDLLNELWTNIGGFLIDKKTKNISLVLYYSGVRVEVLLIQALK
jgi:hypothetical protein